MIFNKSIFCFSKLIISFILLIISIGALNGQRFYAKSDARKIIQGSYVEVEFVLENAKGTQFTPPRFEGFTKVSGPSTSTSMQFINGQTSSSQSYGFSLIGEQIGRFTIGPALIKVNGKNMRTQPIIIEVVKGNNNTNVEKKSFVQVELSDSTASVGQQILLDYRLFTTEDVVNYDIAQYPDFDGFYVEEIRLSRQNFTREIINGVEYKTQLLKRYALFPQQTGTYEIKATDVTLGIGTGQQSRSFFMTQRTRPYRTRTNDVTIYIKNTPRPEPVDFSGAVGQYKLISSAKKRSISTDETLNITMKVSGNGDNRMVLAPKFELPEGLTMYDPNLIDENAVHRNGQIQHEKLFEFLIVGEKVGKYRIVPSMSYYDPNSDEYIQLKGTTLNVTVYQGSGNPVAENTKEDLKAFSTINPKSKFNKIEGGFYGSIIHRSLVGLILLGFIGIGFKRYQLIQLGKLDPKIEIQKNAYPKAIKGLDEAQLLITRNEGKAYFEKSSLIFKNFLNDKFEIPAIHIKKEELLKKLELMNLKEDMYASAQQLLDKAEQALYAPITISDMENSHQQLINLLQYLESEI